MLETYEGLTVMVIYGQKITEPLFALEITELDINLSDIEIIFENGKGENGEVVQNGDGDEGLENGDDSEDSDYVMECEPASDSDSDSESDDANPKLTPNLKTTADWLRKTDVRLWARSHFSTNSKCDVLVNNFTESFNSYILQARDLPIISMFEWIRKKLMERIQVKKAGMERYTGQICPNIVDKLESIKVESGRLGHASVGASSSQSTPRQVAPVPSSGQRPLTQPPKLPTYGGKGKGVAASASGSGQGRGVGVAGSGRGVGVAGSGRGQGRGVAVAGSGRGQGRGVTVAGSGMGQGRGVGVAGGGRGRGRGATASLSQVLENIRARKRGRVE
ncbi:hypothetical protein RHMOL_Rhmol02G0141500 [Rhododendron molle]|uniref:Uncharacterized protein n=1 Tax=Rhododendron molle TaxID=49168 RepID=A0ACC0PPP0_RHOML|nr:hypothetical protein RHMOL_Rhmol02G0141500 [Rhododendron molle]